MPIDLRQHFALERTLLAYIRTGLAFVGMGFVIARFGDTPAALWFGVALVFLGGLAGILSAASYLRHLHRLNQLLELSEKPSPLGVAMSLTLASIGAAMAAYFFLLT